MASVCAATFDVAVYESPVIARPAAFKDFCLAFCATWQ